MSLTSRSRATLKTLLSLLFSTYPYNLTLFVVAHPFTVSSNPSIPICSLVVFLSTTFQPCMTLSKAFSVPSSFYRLKSRCPFVPVAWKLLQDLTELDIRAAQWTDFKWSTEYSECSSNLRAFIPRASTRPMGMGLPRSSWVRLNHLRAGVGCFQSFMHEWGLAPTLNCACGAAEQTAEHIILTCPIHWAPTGIRGLTVLDVDTQCWLSTITASI